MTTRRNLIALAWTFLTVAAVGQESAMLDPSLATYRSARESLLAEGWKPDANYGQKLMNGKPAYRFPEVVCGPHLCNGKWRDRRGNVKVISILRGNSREEYRVAPQ